MRYRRYYSQKNRDGSRTVVSMGPFASGYYGFVKILFTVLLIFGFFAWPGIVVSHNLKGEWAWAVGVPAELIWLGIVSAVWFGVKSNRATVLKTSRRLVAKMEHVVSLRTTIKDLDTATGPILRQVETQSKGAAKVANDTAIVARKGNEELAREGLSLWDRLDEQLAQTKTQYEQLRVARQQAVDALAQLGVTDVPPAPDLGPSITLDIKANALVALVRSQIATQEPVVSLDQEESGERNVGWGMLAFAEELSQGIVALELQYERYLYGAIETTGEVVTDFAAYGHTQTDALTEAIRTITTIFAPEARSRAFGPGGTGGDERAIHEFAEGIKGVYASLIDVGLRIRAAQVPTEWQRAVALMADLPKLLIQQIREFSATLLSDGTEHVIGWREQKHTRPFNLTLKLAVDTKAVMAEMRRLPAG